MNTHKDSFWQVQYQMPSNPGEWVSWCLYGDAETAEKEYINAINEKGGPGWKWRLVRFDGVVEKEYGHEVGSPRDENDSTWQIRYRRPSHPGKWFLWSQFNNGDAAEKEYIRAIDETRGQPGWEWRLVRIDKGANKGEALAGGLPRNESESEVIGTPGTTQYDYFKFKTGWQEKELARQEAEIGRLNAEIARLKAIIRSVELRAEFVLEPIKKENI